MALSSPLMKGSLSPNLPEQWVCVLGHGQTVGSGLGTELAYLPLGLPLRG